MAPATHLGWRKGDDGESADRIRASCLLLVDRIVKARCSSYSLQNTSISDSCFVR
jgi:hypothetical protein